MDSAVGRSAPSIGRGLVWGRAGGRCVTGGVVEAWRWSIVEVQCGGEEQCAGEEGG